jgi:hypothetical protein
LSAWVSSILSGADATGLLRAPVGGPGIASATLTAHTIVGATLGKRAENPAEHDGNPQRERQDGDGTTDHGRSTAARHLAVDGVVVIAITKPISVPMVVARSKRTGVA